MRPLALVMVVSMVLGFTLMFLFEHTITRVVGVVALFAFIVSGVFVIADPGFLAAYDDQAPRERPR